MIDLVQGLSVRPRGRKRAGCGNERREIGSLGEKRLKEGCGTPAK